MDKVLEEKLELGREGGREYGGWDTVPIVDDIEVNRITLRGILEKDYNPLETENSDQAVLFLKQYHRQIAAVLLGLAMP